MPSKTKVVNACLAHKNPKMKTILLSITLFYLILKSDGFNLNKLGRSSRYSRDNLQMAEPMEQEREIFLGDFLLGQSRGGSRNKAWSLGNSGLDTEEMALLGRGGHFLVRKKYFFDCFIYLYPLQHSEPYGLRSGGVRLSITNSLDILRERLMREMARNRNTKPVSINIVKCCHCNMFTFSLMVLVTKIEATLVLLDKWNFCCLKTNEWIVTDFETTEEEK
jgi:hypothetical protein